MDWLEFGLLLNANLTAYLFSLGVAAVIYFIIFRRMFLSVLDPITFSIVFSGFGFSVVIFLFITNTIDNKYFYSYLLTQTAFIIGFFSFKQLTPERVLSENKIINFQKDGLYLQCLFLISSLFYIVAQLISYKVIGVPLLLGNHIDLYNNAGGWGLLGRLIDVSKPLSVFLLIDQLFKKEKNLLSYLYKYFFLIVLIVFFALSGSRSEFMLIGLIFFCFLLLNAEKQKKYYLKLRRYEIILLSIGMIFVFFTIIFKHNTNPTEAGSLEIFVFRLVASGDVYYFGYPNNKIELLKHSNAFLALFGDIFSTLRIIPRTSQPVVLGFQLFNMFGVSDTIAGPNARHNVFGYVYFGYYGSIFFSFILGLILSFTRNKLFFSFRRLVLGQALFTIVYTQVAVLETDAPMVISNLENITLILPVLLVLSFSVFILIKKYNIKYE